MRSFKDRHGKDWLIELTIGNVAKVKAITSLDLLDLAHHERCQPLMERLTSDPFLICDIIFTLASPDTPKEVFAEALDGDAVEAATEALLNAITDFSPRQRRPLLAKVVDKLRGLEAKQTQAAMALLDDPRMDQTLDAILTSGKTSTNSQESLASTPAP